MYAALKIRSAIDLGKASDASQHFDLLESTGTMTNLTQDASEARWIADALQRIVDRNAPQDIESRAEHLIRAINERLMSTYPLLSNPLPISQSNIWDELEAAGYTRSPTPEQVEQQPEQKKEDQTPVHDDDEMAETAGRLLERVADNTSEKFQNSQFLELMRRLRDREVRVEGDKVVEVSPLPSSVPPSNDGNLTPYPPTTVPEIDPHILDHAATDFALPTAPDEDAAYALSRQSTNEPLTDEISEQFSYYNVNAAYHR